MTRIVRYVCGVAMGAIAVASSYAAIPTLGQASDFAVLGLGGTASIHGSVIINSSTSLTGDVGYGAYTVSTTNQKVDSFVGQVLVHSTATFSYTAATFAPTGGIHIGTGLPGDPIDGKLNQATADALAASAGFSGMPTTPGMFFGAVTSNLTINSTGPVNVISLASLDMNSNLLTLNSRPGFTDFFVFNVAGNFDFSQSDTVLNGTDSGHVLFNLTGVNASVVINKSSSVFYGTVLAPSTTADITYHNPATYEGAIIAYNIDLHSDFNLSHSGFVPAPGFSMLLLAGAAFGSRRRPA